MNISLSHFEPETEAMLLAFEQLAETVCLLDGQGHFIWASESARALLGWPPIELRGKLFPDLVAEEDRPAGLRFLTEGMNGLMQQPFFIRCLGKDGRARPVSWSAKWNGQQNVFYCTVRDGFVWQEYERKSRQDSLRLNRAYKLARVGWWEWKIASGERVSEELCAIFGWDRSVQPAFGREAYFSLVHPEDRQAVQESWRVMMEQREYHFGHRIIRPSGEVAYVEHQVQLINNPEGTLTEIYGTTQDVTREKMAEEALRWAQRRLEQLVESLGDGFYVVDSNWTVTYWNRKIEQITGVRREEVLGRSIFELYPQSKELKIFPEFQRAVRENRSVHFEEGAPSHSLWLEINAYPSEEGGLYVLIKDITEQKRHHEERCRLDEQLQKANDNLQHVLESMSDGFFILDRDWIITYANDRVLGMIGVSREEMVGRNVWEWLPLSIHSKFYSGYHKAFAENTFVSVEDFLPHFNMWFEANAYPYNDELLVFVRNIDERKRQEQELRISNERFQFVSQATSDVIWDWNVETGELYINQSFTRVFGHELSQGVSPHLLWESNLHPDDKERVASSQAEALQNSNVFQWGEHYRFIKANGGITYVCDRAVIIRNPEGVALRMVGAVQDITEHRKQQQRLEFMARATSEVIWERSLNSEFVEVSGEKLRQLFGYEAENNRISVPFWKDCIHPEDVASTEENRVRALAQGQESYVNEYRFKRKDSSCAWVKNRIHIVRSEEGRPEALIGALEDVTVEHLAEVALQESEKSYRQLFDNAPLPNVIIDAETLCILDANSAALAQYGFSREEMLSRNVLDFLPKEEHRRLLKNGRAFRSAGTSNLGTLTNLKKGGEKIRVEVSVTSMRYKGKAAVLATIKDVTERERLQQALVKQEISHQRNITRAAIEAQEKERSEIGRELHDNVNQILTSAKLYVENLNYFPDQRDAFVAKGVSLLQKSINEIRRLSRALVTPDTSGESFGETLLELVDSYRELCLFEVDFSFGPGEIRDQGLRLTIYRILQEAFNNTVKYAEASLVHLDIMRTRRRVQVRYRDNGRGFDPAAVKKGLGLKNIQNRAEAHRGKVRLFSSAGNGCSLTIGFPLEE